MGIEFNTGIRSSWYTSHCDILCGFEDSHGKMVAVEPEDENAIYYWTRFLQDEELKHINIIRQAKGFTFMPRLANVGNGKFAAVYSQRERMDVEKKIFADKKINVTTIENLAKNINFQRGA